MNYRTNEDRRLANEPLSALYNNIISIDEDFGSGTGTEPVSLSEVKSYLRLEGFTADDDSGESEFDYDDDLIESMITEARMWVEKFTGVLVVPREITAVILNQAGMMRLPGPVRGSVVITDTDSIIQDSANYKMIGTEFKTLETSFSDRVNLVYDAGYVTAPKWAVNAIKAYIADHYEFRGDNKPDAPNERAAQICRPYRRVQLWA